MKAAGASIIFAVDVGAQDDRNYTNYGDHLSGFWLLWKKWNPWAEPVSHLTVCVKGPRTLQIKLQKSSYCSSTLQVIFMTATVCATV